MSPAANILLIVLFVLNNGAVPIGTEKSIKFCCRIGEAYTIETRSFECNHTYKSTIDKVKIDEHIRPYQNEKSDTFTHIHSPKCASFARLWKDFTIHSVRIV